RKTGVAPHPPWIGATLFCGLCPRPDPWAARLPGPLPPFFAKKRPRHPAPVGAALPAPLIALRAAAGRFFHPASPSGAARPGRAEADHGHVVPPSIPGGGLRRAQQFLA